MPELNTDIERGHISRPRKVRPNIRQRKLAKLAVAGEYTYTELAEKLNMDTVAPRQTVYSALLKQGAKIAVKEELNKVYDADMLKNKLTELIHNDNPRIQLDSVALGMRSLGMLIDRVESEQLVITAEQIRGKDAPTLAQELAHLLKQVGQGAKLSPDGGEVALSQISENSLKSANSIKQAKGESGESGSKTQ